MIEAKLDGFCDFCYAENVALSIPIVKEERPDLFVDKHPRLPRLAVETHCGLVLYDRYDEYKEVWKTRFNHTAVPIVEISACDECMPVSICDRHLSESLEKLRTMTDAIR